MWQGLKKFCEDNSSIIDVFSKLVLGIFALVISLKSCSISDTQAKLMEQQTTIQSEQTAIQKSQEEIASKQMSIDKSQYLPKLKLRLTSNNKEKIPEIVISNYGGPLYGGRYDVHTFLALRELILMDLKSGKPIGKSRYRKIELPIQDTFSSIEYDSDAYNDVLARIPQMDLRHLETTEASFEKTRSDADEDVDGTLEIFVTVTYSDQFNETETKTYKVDEINQKLIPKNDWTHRLSLYDTSYKSHTILSAANITPQQLEVAWTMNQ